MTLDAAINVILRERDGRFSREIADAINKRGLYRRKDGEPVPTSQITARVGNKTYRDRYRKDADGRIYLATPR